MSVIPVYYSQNDTRWSGKTYYTDPGGDEHSIQQSACGPTAVAMTVASLTVQNVNPYDIAQYAQSVSGAISPGQGTNGLVFVPQAAMKYGLNYQIGTAEDMKAQINQPGVMAIVSLGPGHFTGDGHFIVINGMTKIDGVDYYLILDPNNANKSYGDDGVVIRSEIPGTVLAKASEINKESWDTKDNPQFFIISSKTPSNDNWLQLPSDFESREAAANFASRIYDIKPKQAVSADNNGVTGNATTTTDNSTSTPSVADTLYDFDGNQVTPGWLNSPQNDQSMLLLNDSAYQALDAANKITWSWDTVNRDYANITVEIDNWTYRADDIA